MKKFLSGAAALVSAAIITVCGSIAYFPANAKEEQKGIKVSYDFGIEGFTYNDKLVDMSQFDSYITESRAISIPNADFDHPDYYFAGWTYDGIIGYRKHETVVIPEGVDDFTLKAVWYDPEGKETYSVKYNLEFEGEIYDHPEWLADRNLLAGIIFEPNYAQIDIGVAKSHGFTDGEREYQLGQKIVLDHDVVLTPLWYRQVNFIYEAGDVDRLNGNTRHSFPESEGGSVELQEADRFSRNGFTLAGWHSDYDGKDYKPGETVKVPGKDVTFTAIWEPKNYTIVFKPGNKGDFIKLQGLTDTTIECPEPGVEVAGQYFVGWKDDKGDMYKVGDEYFIYGALPGAGLLLTGVWADGEPPVDPADIKLGDVNLDGEITSADAALLLQHLGNPDKYPLSALAKANADCYDQGSGLSALDVLSIQKLEAKVIKSLPENPAKK